jgi:hypothetical protein
MNEQNKDMTLEEELANVLFKTWVMQAENEEVDNETMEIEKFISEKLLTIWVKQYKEHKDKENKDKDEKVSRWYDAYMEYHQL